MEVKDLAIRWDRTSETRPLFRTLPSCQCNMDSKKQVLHENQAFPRFTPGSISTVLLPLSHNAASRTLRSGCTHWSFLAEPFVIRSERSIRTSQALVNEPGKKLGCHEKLDVLPQYCNWWGFDKTEVSGKMVRNFMGPGSPILCIIE